MTKIDETIDADDIRLWDYAYSIHPFFGEKNRNQIVIKNTRGAYLYSAEGSRYLDFASQSACTNLGYGNAEINRAAVAALDEVGFVWSKFLTSYRALAAKRLIEDIPGVDRWAGKVLFVNSGSEAIEVALRLARLISKKPKILVKENDFHGWTREALSSSRIVNWGVMKDVSSGSISDGSRSTDFLSVPSPFCDQCPLGKKYDVCKTLPQLACVLAAEHVINQAGADEIAAYLAEPISGFGTVFPPKEYIPQIRALTKKYGIMWIDDEILTGFGRLGSWFAYDAYDDVFPDIMCVGKGLVNSIVPCGAVVVSKEIAELLEDRVWISGGTFWAHPVAMAAVASTVKYMLDHRVIQKAKVSGAYLGERLQTLIERFPSYISGVKGTGFFWSIEIRTSEAKDGVRKIALGGATTPASRLITRAFDRGLILGGLLPDSVRVCPPLTLTHDEIDHGVELLAAAIGDCIDDQSVAAADVPPEK